ncbi:MAG: hypothetical protein ACTSX6_07580 [Candidatus Heimdallarchaeaceae archaeon]
MSKKNFFEIVNPILVGVIIFFSFYNLYQLEQLREQPIMVQIDPNAIDEPVFEVDIYVNVTDAPDDWNIIFDFNYYSTIKTLTINYDCRPYGYVLNISVVCFYPYMMRYPKYDYRGEYPVDYYDPNVFQYYSTLTLTEFNPFNGTIVLKNLTFWKVVE